MKEIFSTLLNCKDSLQNYVKKVSKSGEEVEIRKTTARYTTNAISSVAFGIDIDCFADPNTSFREYGRQLLETSLKNAFRVFCFNLGLNRQGNY